MKHVNLTTALAVYQLKKTYNNGIKALQGINLTVNAGDFFALLGQNGAGKSTTIGIISSLIRKTSGKVFVFGYDTDQAITQAKTLVGVVPQEINFNGFEKSLHILINQAGYYGIPRKTALPLAEYYLKELGLWHMHDQPAMRLSGGMKRRLLIARALMNNPKLLILDEPTAGVDVELRHTLWKFLQAQNQRGTTIILTTHYLEEAEQLCNHIAIIDNGYIIKQTDVKSFLSEKIGQTLILNLVEPIYVLPDLPDYTCTMLDNLTIEVSIPQQYAINDLFSLLTQQNIKVISMRNKINRLEERFLMLIRGLK